MTADETPSSFDHRSFLRNLTRQPGVYQMYDDTDAILYVGKAKNLKNRVSSYFQKTGLSPKTRALVRRIANIEVTVAASEADALVLEQNLIKAQRPPYNILLRDDKSYPYILLSNHADFPRISLHRGPKNKQGRYFGPFPSAGAVRESLHFLQKTFQVRQCEDSVFKNRTRPCLQYQIGRCRGPCVDLVSPADYAGDVHHTELFLQSRSDVLHEELVADMEQASAAMDFERAAQLRDQITALRRVQSQTTAESGDRDVDVIAAAVAGGIVCVHVLFVRKGRVLGSKSYFPKDHLGDDEAGLLSQFVPQFYFGMQKLEMPPEAIVSHMPPDSEAITAAIKAVTGRNFDLYQSVRAHRAKWLAMAVEAAEQNLRNRLGSQAVFVAKFEALQQIMGLEELPERIECFDISHSSGERPVASCVVFNSAGSAKSEYRRFNIKDITPGDDYAAMEQAITRRYSRLQKENIELPTILVVDGGKGQLSKARAVKAELGLADMALLGIAKGTTRKAGFETLIFEDGRERVLGSDDPALHLLQQIRDEAHRFAITGHKRARDKSRRTSTLEDIAGVGPKRRRQLLQQFGGLQELRRASIEEIARVPGISKKLAEEVYTILHSE